MCSLVEKTVIFIKFKKKSDICRYKAGQLTPKQHNLNSWVDYTFEPDNSSSNKSDNLYGTNMTKL